MSIKKAFRRQGIDSDYKKAFSSVKTSPVKKAFRRQGVDSDYAKVCDSYSSVM